MREVLFRGQRVANKKWVEGDLFKQFSVAKGKDDWYIKDGNVAYLVIPETVGECANVPDRKGEKVFEGDIIQYTTLFGFDCQSVVKFGKYEQDGSGGEYGTATCIGFYAEVDNFTCPDWDDDPDMFKDYLKQQSLLEIEDGFEIIGNIYDNPEILEV